MAAPTYCSADELRDRLCLTGTDRDNALNDIVEASSRWVENRISRRFYTVTETRYYTAAYPWRGYGWAWNYERPSGGWWTSQEVKIDDFMSVSQVATDENNDGVYEVVWSPTTDYWLAPRNAALEGKPYRVLHRALWTGAHIFPAWDNAIAVTGACGAATTVPTPIRELTLIVSEAFAKPLLDMVLPGVQSYKIGLDLSVTVSDEDLPERARAIIADYSSTGPSVL